MDPAPRCPRGHPMRVMARFRFDHEPGDSARDAERLTEFEAMGIELGADVTLWYCAACDYAQAEFDHSGADARK
jgi:hypothetical protein